MPYRDLTKTVFGDLRHEPAEIYRVQTESSTYVVSLHEERGRKYVLVRGQAGTDREAVVVRDSDPKIGDAGRCSTCRLPSGSVGRPLDVATMRTSAIVSVTRVGPGATLQDQVAVHIPPPPGMSDSPAIVPMPGRGTNIAANASGLTRARSWCHQARR